MTSGMKCFLNQLINVDFFSHLLVFLTIRKKFWQNITVRNYKLFELWKVSGQLKLANLYFIILLPLKSTLWYFFKRVIRLLKAQHGCYNRSIVRCKRIKLAVNEFFSFSLLEFSASWNLSIGIFNFQSWLKIE